MKVNKIISVLALCTCILFALTSCEKESDATLTDGVWTFNNLTTDSEDETIQQLLTLVKVLMTDSKLEFQENGNYLITSPLADDPSTGTWQLIGNDQLIMNPEGEAASTANIETLTSSKLSYIETMVDAEMNTYSTTTTWTR